MATAEVMELRNFIGGRFVATECGLMDTVEPSTGALLARLPDSGEQEVDQAVAAAKAAFPAYVGKNNTVLTALY